MLTLPYREHTYLRIISTRTAETLFEARMIAGALIIWGAHYRPSDFHARLSADGATITLAGELRDRYGDVVTFGDVLEVAAGFRVDAGRLPDGYDASWTRDRT